MPYLRIDTVDTQKTHKPVELEVDRFETGEAQRRLLLRGVEAKWYERGSTTGKMLMRADPTKTELTKNPLESVTVEAGAANTQLAQT